ncbi:hypothetical protein RUND412_000309 [Rhizina undulata]
MPSTAFGISAYLSTLDGSTLPETASQVTYSTTQKLPHPLYTNTIVTPASTTAIPFNIRLEFDAADPSTPDYLKGDMRIEVHIDGQLAALRIFKHEKIRPANGKFILTLSGIRCARTAEHAFIFLPLPSGSDIPEPGTENSVLDPYNGSIADPNSDHNKSNSDLLEPMYPVSNLSPNTSHIQVLITLGKTHRTLEKYLIFSPLYLNAFYIPPDPRNPLDPSKWVPPGNALGKSPRQRQQTGAKALHTLESHLLALSTNTTNTTSVLVENDNEELGNTGKVAKKGKQKNWRLVGLATQTQKTVQAKEVEFSGRMHLVRFWFFVVPNCNSTALIPQAPAQATETQQHENFQPQSEFQNIPENFQEKWPALQVKDRNTRSTRKAPLKPSHLLKKDDNNLNLDPPKLEQMSLHLPPLPQASHDSSGDLPDYWSSDPIIPDVPIQGANYGPLLNHDLDRPILGATQLPSPRDVITGSALLASTEAEVNEAQAAQEDDIKSSSLISTSNPMTVKKRLRNWDEKREPSNPASSNPVKKRLRNWGEKREPSNPAADAEDEEENVVVGEVAIARKSLDGKTARKGVIKSAVETGHTALD